MAEHRVVGHDAWVEARRKHLAKEKEFTRLRDQLSRERRELPWELVEKEYTFEGEPGTQTLSELFDGRGHPAPEHRWCLLRHPVERPVRPASHRRLRLGRPHRHRRQRPLHPRPQSPSPNPGTDGGGDLIAW